MSQTEDLSPFILESCLSKQNVEFLNKLKAHSKKTGATFKPSPIFLNRETNLYGLYQEITKMGGYHKVCEGSLWRKFTPPGEQQTKASSLIRVIYKKYLLAYERDHFKGYPRLELTNEIEHDRKVSPVASSKAFDDSNEAGPPDSSIQENIQDFYFSPINVQWVYETDRIALALESGLPNEMEWGLEALLRWSNGCPLSYSIEQFPYLRTVLLDEFSKYCDLLNSALLRRSGTLVPLPFLILALGLRNCTLSEESAANLAEASHLPEQIIQLLRLPQSAPPLMNSVNYPELRTYCVDILDNLGMYIIPSASFLAWLYRSILGDDRSQVLGGLRLMSKMLLGKHDEALRDVLDHDMLLQHIFALLTLPGDAELHAAVVEFLILYSYFLPDRLVACATQCPYLISSLIGLLMARQNTGSNEILSDQAGNPLRSIEHWLRTKCESTPLQKLAALELYSEYMQEPRTRRLPTLSAAKLIRIARMVFPNSQIVQIRRRGKNQFFLTRVGRKAERLVFDVPASRKPQPRANEGIPCSWTNCQAVLETKALALEHIKLTHMPSVGEHYYCEWQGCKDAYTQKAALRHALLTHMRYHINIAHRNLPEPTSCDRQTPVPTRTVASPPPPATHTPNDFSGLLVDLLKKLAIFPSFVPAFLPHHATLLFIAANVPLLSRDLVHILDLVSQHEEPEPTDGNLTSPGSLDLMD